MKPLIRYILLFISMVTFVLPYRTARACGFYVSPGEYRFWLLQPDITNQPDLTPFFFASTYLYKQDINAATESWQQRNVNEWMEEINGKAVARDVDSLLNNTKPQYFFDHPQVLTKQNSFFHLLQEPQNRELYRYVVLSKKVEQIATNPDPWDENDSPTGSIEKIIAEAKILREEAHSSFVKFRTAFQLERLYIRNGENNRMSDVYDAWIAPVKVNSWIKSAALYQKAINSDGIARNYLLSKVFDNGDYNRTPCLMRFRVDKFDSTLMLAKNQHERNVITAMRTFNYSGRSMQFIKQIYRSEPTSKQLSFLLLREINKVEDWLMTNKLSEFGVPAVYGEDYFDNYNYTDNATENYKNDRIYARQLYEFVLQVIRDNKSKQPALFNLYASHLAMLNGDMVGSSQHLQNAMQQKNLPQNIKTQIRINTYLLQLEKGFGEEAEQQFMAIIKTPDQQLGIYDPVIMKNQLILYTARKMMKQHDTRGLMLLSKTNRALGEIPGLAYLGVWQVIEEKATEKDYKQMLAIFDKKEKTAFERFISQGKFSSPVDYYYENNEDPDALKWNRNKILDCQSGWYIRNHRIPEALAIVKQIPDSYWKKFPYTDFIKGDPFYLNVYRAYAPGKEDKRSLNKRQVLEQMVYLEQLAVKNPKKAGECYLQLANAWYNMTYYGKNWLMVKQWWSSGEFPGYDADRKPPETEKDYYGCRQAKLYYLKAIRVSPDKKLQALCFFMAEQCDKNYRNYTENINALEEEDADKILKGSYVRARQNHIDAAYYQSIVEECEQYQSFIRQYNRQL